jgi:hypothetical protein
MPRRHSSLSVNLPYKSTFTNTRLYRNNLGQEKAVLRRMEDYVNIWIYPQYVHNYDPDNTELQQYDDFYGEAIENEMKFYAGYDLYNTFSLQTNRNQIQSIAQNTLNMIKVARRGFVIQSLTAVYTQEISELRINVNMLKAQVAELEGGFRPKTYNKPLLAEVEAEVSLDIRYYLYIKEFGVPEDGFFDPVKLSSFVYIDSSGNEIANQEALQYPDGVNPEHTVNVVDQWAGLDTNPFVPRPNYDHWQ